MNWGSEQWNVLASHLHPQETQESPSCQSTMHPEALWSFRVITWFPVMKHSETYSSEILCRPHSIYIYTAHKCIRYHSQYALTDFQNLWQISFKTQNIQQKTEMHVVLRIRMNNAETRGLKDCKSQPTQYGMSLVKIPIKLDRLWHASTNCILYAANFGTMYKYYPGSSTEIW